MHITVRRLVFAAFEVQGSLLVYRAGSDERGLCVHWARVEKLSGLMAERDSEWWIGLSAKGKC